MSGLTYTLITADMKVAAEKASHDIFSGKITVHDYTSDST